MYNRERTLAIIILGIAVLPLHSCSNGDGLSTPSAPPLVSGNATPLPPLVTTTGLNQADVNLPLEGNFVLAATGSGPLSWELTGGSLPAGVSLKSTGELIGTPMQEGGFSFTVQVGGPGGTATKDLKLVVLGTTHRVSVVSAMSSTTPLGEADGPSGNHTRSFDPGISNNGRFAVFDSAAGNLVPQLNPAGIRQIYLHDRQTGLTEMISVNASGAPGNNDSFVATISDDGNTIVFDSFASNLDSNDTNNSRDVFLRDRIKGTTQRISQFLNGSQGICNAPDPLACNSSDPSISADGSIVAFGSLSRLTADDTDDLGDVFVLNRKVLSLQRVSLGIGGSPSNGFSGSPAISANGRFLAFTSEATNLIAGDTVDSASDVFMFDLQTNFMRKASVVAGGLAANGNSFTPSVSGDGRFVAFWSQASNLLADSNGVADIFVADMQDTPPSLKMIVNLQSQQGNGESRVPSISRDGKVIAFDSLASNLDPSLPGNGVRDIYVIDRSCSTTFNSGPCTLKRASVSSDGNASNNESRYPALAGDGQYVAYFSDATNLVPASGDNNGFRDAFVSRRQ